MKKTDTKDLKSLLVMVTGFSLLSWYFKTKEYYQVADILFYVSVAIGSFSLLIPRLGKLIVLGWYKIGMVLGWINSRIILTALFYLFLFPIALIYRLFNKDQMHIRRGAHHKVDSLYTERNHLYEPKDLENMW